MNIIREHRTTLRAGNNTSSIEVTALPGGDRDQLMERLVIRVGAAGADGEPVADGQIEVAAGTAETLGSVLAEPLRHHAALADRGGRRGRDRPVSQGRPWTAELDGKLERRWIAGESVADIARELGRSPGGIRARLPRVGCDPERRGEYLPEPPSMRTTGQGSGDAA